jgi:hypothetical protein
MQLPDRKEEAPPTEPVNVQKDTSAIPESLSVSCGPGNSNYSTWENHKLPSSDGYQLKYFNAAHRYFVSDFNGLFGHCDIRKVLDILKNSPAKVRERSVDYERMAALMRAAAENLNLIADTMSR